MVVCLINVDPLGHSLASFLTDWTRLYVLLYICIRCTFSYE